MLDGFAATDVATPTGARIRVRTAGTGQPVVLLHGYPQTSAMWHLVAPELAAPTSSRGRPACPTVAGGRETTAQR